MYVCTDVHPPSRIPLDPVHHIVYPCDYPVRFLPRGTEAWAIEPHFLALMVARTVDQPVVTSFHPVTGKLQVLAEPMNVLHMVHLPCHVINY
jgi:hypothetical protein